MGFRKENPDSFCMWQKNLIIFLVRKRNYSVYLAAVGLTENWTIELVFKTSLLEVGKKIMNIYVYEYILY